MTKLSLKTMCVVIGLPLACAGVAGTDASAPSNAPAQAVDVPTPDQSQDEIDPAATAPPEVPACADAVTCLRSCVGCDETQRAEAQHVVATCANACPALSAEQREAQVGPELMGLALGAALRTAQVRCSELGGIWSKSEQPAYEGECRSAAGPWGLPIRLLIGAYEGRITRIEWSYLLGKNETAAQVAQLFAHLFRQSHGAPTYVSLEQRPSYSWRSDSGPYLSVLGDDDERTVNVWVKNAL